MIQVEGRAWAKSTQLPVSPHPGHQPPLSGQPTGQSSVFTFPEDSVPPDAVSRPPGCFHNPPRAPFRALSQTVGTPAAPLPTHEAWSTAPSPPQLLLWTPHLLRGFSSWQSQAPAPTPEWRACGSFSGRPNASKPEESKRWGSRGRGGLKRSSQSDLEPRSPAERLRRDFAGEGRAGFQRRALPSPTLQPLWMETCLERALHLTHQKTLTLI